LAAHDRRAINLAGTVLGSFVIKDASSNVVEGVFPSQYAIPQMMGDLHSTDLPIPPLWCALSQ